MDIKQIITATVAVILICLVAIPLIQTSSEGIYSTENNTTERFMMASAGSTETVTLEFSKTTGYSVNGVVIPQPSTATWDVKAFWPGGFAKYNGVGFMEINGNGAESRFNITKIVYDPVEKTLTYTATSGDVVIENVPYMYYMAEDGDYGLFISNNAISINKDSEYFVFIENTNLRDFGAYRSGYLYKNDTLVDTIIDPKFAGVDSANNFQDTTISFNLNIEDVDSKHFVINGLSDTVINGTPQPKIYASIVAPIEYKYITDNESIIISLLDLIPILLIAAVLIGIGYSLMRRD